jgi:hypothetical protein
MCPVSKHAPDSLSWKSHNRVGGRKTVSAPPVSVAPQIAEKQVFDGQSRDLAGKVPPTLTGTEGTCRVMSDRSRSINPFIWKNILQNVTKKIAR